MIEQIKKAALRWSRPEDSTQECSHAPNITNIGGIVK